MRLGTGIAIVLLCTCERSAEAQAPTFEPIEVAATGVPRGVVAADFNRDGWTDLALGGTGRDAIAIVLNRRGSSGFVLSSEIVVGGGPFELTEEI